MGCICNTCREYSPHDTVYAVRAAQVNIGLHYFCGMQCSGLTSFIISYTAEPLTEFLRRHPPPRYNV